jgi:hypothetical protein
VRPLYYTDGEMSRTLVDDPAPSSLEEVIQAFVNAIGGEREALWEAGDILAPFRGDRKALGLFAQAAKSSLTRCRQLSEVSASFEPGLRDRERSWTWHRAVRHAAQRIARPIPEVLQEAQEKDYGQRELNALGRNRSFVSWAGTCADCDARMSVRMMGGCKGHPVACPYCAARVADSEHVMEYIPILGSLA